MVRADDEEQKAILDILKDCVGSLKAVVIQAGVFARNHLAGKVRLAFIISPFSAYFSSL